MRALVDLREPAVDGRRQQAREGRFALGGAARSTRRRAARRATARAGGDRPTWRRWRRPARSGGRPASAAWRRSTSSTMASSSSSREPKWWSSMRWLVPTRVRDVAQRPSADPAAGRTRRSARRAAPGGAARQAGEASRRRSCSLCALRPSRLELQVALGQPRMSRPTATPIGPRWSIRWRTRVRPPSSGDDLVRRERGGAGRPLAPRPRRARLDLGHLPHDGRQPWLLDLEAPADLDAGAVEGHDPLDRRRPFGPALHIGEHVPDRRCRCLDLDRCRP